MYAIGAGALAPAGAFAQQKVARIGLLGLANATAYAANIDAFLSGLKDLGYIDGKNIRIEYRWADGHYDRLKDLAAELVQQKVELIVTHGSGAQAAKSASATIPIVTYVGDIVAVGLAASFAHPGGTITGSSFFGPEISVKRLEVFKEGLSGLRSASLFYNASSGTFKAARDAVQSAAAKMNVKLAEHPIKSAEDIEGTFAAIARDRSQGVVLLEDPMLIANFKTIAGIALKRRLPSIGYTDYAEAGGLMTSGVSLVELWRRHAYFVDKILKGAKPADIPIEQPTRFELVINLKTAKALGIKLPQTLIQRADRLIE